MTSKGDSALAALVAAVLGGWVIYIIVKPWASSNYAHIARGMTTLTTVIFYTVLIVIVLGVLAAVVIGSAVARREIAESRTRRRMLDASAQMAENEAAARVIIAKAGEQVYLIDPSQNVTAAHRLVAARWNGTVPQPTQADLIGWKLYESCIKVGGGKLGDLPQLMAPTMPELLAECARFDRVLNHGGSGSGKTNLTQHIAAGFDGQVVILDPHDDGRTWPGNANVIGGGENWQAIEDELHGWVQEKRSRYELRSRDGADPGAFPPMLMIADEWMAIVSHCDTAGDCLKDLITAIRKVSMHLWLLTQSDRVNALGIKGNYDLIDCFEAIIRMRGNKNVGWAAKVQTIDGEYEAVPPGPYHGGARVAVPSSVPTYQPGTTTRQIPATEANILQLFDGGMPPYRIGQMIYRGKGGEIGQGGGKQTELVNAVLHKYGRL